MLTGWCGCSAPRVTMVSLDALQGGLWVAHSSLHLRPCFPSRLSRYRRPSSTSSGTRSSSAGAAVGAGAGRGRCTMLPVLDGVACMGWHGYTVWLSADPSPSSLSPLLSRHLWCAEGKTDYRARKRLVVQVRAHKRAACGDGGDVSFVPCCVRLKSPHPQAHVSCFMQCFRCHHPPGAVVAMFALPVP
jgi:hypothetical protein